MNDASGDLHDFKVLKEIGRGSSSVVLLAYQKSLDRLVALKRLLRTRSNDPDEVERLRREAQVIARLDHPAIVRLYDLTTDGADFVLVMEYVSGPTIRTLSRESAPSPSQGLAVVADVAGALGYASKLGVVHRDVKPANVFVTEAGRCKLGDFGLARITSDSLMFRSRDGLARGTPLYMSPEQLRGEHVGPPSDVYSLALLGWELLAGSHPFAGLSVPEIVESHLDGEAASLEPPSSVPAEVVAVLRAGMSPRTGDRPTAEELAAQLLRAAPPAWFDDVLSTGMPGADTGHDAPANLHPVLWGDTRAGGWTLDSVDDSTWPSLERPADTKIRGGSTDEVGESNSEPVLESFEIDDGWIRPPVVQLRERERKRGPRVRPTWLIAAFVLGFALIILIVELALRL